jgi:predicted ferric reductase
MYKRAKIGWIIIFSLLIIGTALWLFSKPTTFSFSENPWKYLGQLAGILGTILISLEYILATRAKIFDRIFGGLDKTYTAHHSLGAFGFILIFFHPTLLALNSSSLLKSLGIHFIPGGIFSYNLGIFALYAYAALLFFTFYIRLPYEVWRKTHTLMGIPLAIATYHILIIGSDIGRYLPLKIFILGLVSLAICSYAYRRFLYERFSSKYEYKISKIIDRGEISDIFMKPQKKPMQFTPGQFAFIRFKGENIPPELHPFSLSSAPEDPELRISIKKLGDFTKNLNSNLDSTVSATLYGPHGEFGHKSLQSKKPEVWIAGGIGVTPFLSMLRHYSFKNDNKEISLIYSAKSANEFIYQDEIDSLAKNLTSLKITYYNSGTDGKINGEKIKNIVGSLHDKKIFMCGPKTMMDSLANSFLTQKIHPRNIIFEDFSFK